MAVGGDGDCARFAGGENGGAVCLPALDHLFVWMTEDRVTANGNDREAWLRGANEVAGRRRFAAMMRHFHDIRV